MTDMLAGRRILIVEDEYFIAMEVTRSLQEEGASIVGPVGTMTAGLDLAEQPVDAAVLDVNLGPTMSYPIADRLKVKGIPYMFLTGYDGWALPPGHRNTARLAKPFAHGAVAAMVYRLIAGEEVTA